MNMKKIKIFATLTALVAVLVSCSEVLNEHPKTFYEPSYFNTEAGVEGGLTYMYRHLRNLYGGQNMTTHQLAGTDEFTWGESAEGNHKIADMNQGDTEWSGSNNPASSVWNNTFTNINTANGVIENGEANGVSPALLAEAYFFRAFDYFLLVQTYGGVPLDLGSGNLKFNAAPSTYSHRTPVDSVYEQCIFPDFEYALANLPETPRKTGAVTKTTARLYLAKAYLTYAWWLENPKGIDTYPAPVKRNSSDAPGYFQKAYNMAIDGIQKAPGIYGLEETFYDLWKGSAGYSKEFLLFADYFYGNGASQYSASLTGMAGGGAPDNCEFWMHNCNYTYIKVSSTGNPATVDAKGNESFDAAEAAITRSGEQGYGRPWARMAPVQGVFTHTFADLRDSRLDVTFNMTYKQNYTRYNTKEDKPAKTVYGAAGQPMEEDAAVLKFIPNQPAGTVSYPSDRGAIKGGANGFAAGQMAGENSYVIEYNHIGRTNFPGPWKTSIVDLTDVNTEIGIIKKNNEPGQPNICNPRPLVIARFAEFYFVAAEANIKGAAPQAGQDAKALMTVIRKRAGKWNHSVAEGTARFPKEVSFDYGDDLVAAMPATLTIDWLLDEYSREFFAEFRRWYDLARTQMWIEKASTYEMGDRFNDGPTAAKTWTRNIKPYYYLRPIPTGQINALMMTEDELKAYQNPGYQN